jgi:hypothetical protein
MTFEYAPAPESRASVSIKPKYGHYIGGKFVPGEKHFPTINPATEEVLMQQLKLRKKRWIYIGPNSRDVNAASTYSALLEFCKSAHVNLLCSKV